MTEEEKFQTRPTTSPLPYLYTRHFFFKTTNRIDYYGTWYYSTTWYKHQAYQLQFLTTTKKHTKTTNNTPPPNLTTTTVYCTVACRHGITDTSSGH